MFTRKKFHYYNLVVRNDFVHNKILRKDLLITITNMESSSFFSTNDITNTYIIYYPNLSNIIYSVIREEVMAYEKKYIAKRNSITNNDWITTETVSVWKYMSTNTITNDYNDNTVLIVLDKGTKIKYLDLGNDSMIGSGDINYWAYIDTQVTNKAGETIKGWVFDYYLKEEK